METIRKYLPHFHTYSLFKKFIANEYKTFQSESGPNPVDPTEFVDSFNRNMTEALKDFSDMTFNQIFFTGDIATIKPRLYFGRLQLKYLKKQVSEFQERLSEDIQGLYYLPVENRIILAMEQEQLSYEKAKLQSEKEYNSDLMVYNYYSKVIATVLDSLEQRINDYYYYFDNDLKSLIPDWDEKDLMGEETIKRITAVILDYSLEEVDNIINTAILKTSRDLKNTNENKTITGDQAGILASFLRSTGFINNISNNDVAKLLNELTGISRQKIRAAIGKVDDKIEGPEFLTEYKRGEDKHDAMEVIKYLKKVIRKIEEKIED